MPIINPTVSVVSQNITWSVCANAECRVKKHQTGKNPPSAEPGCRDAKTPSSLYHKGDIYKELKGRFFHADASAALCVAAITRFLKEPGQHRGEVQCSMGNSGPFIQCPCHSELNLSLGHVSSSVS